MKAGLTIQEMSKEILRQSQAKTDYLVNTANLRMEPWGNEPMLRVLDANGRPRYILSFPLTSRAVRLSQEKISPSYWANFSFAARITASLHDMR